MGVEVVEMMTTQHASTHETDEQDGGAVPARPRLVAAYDGSPESVSALTWAAREAGSLGARLRVVFAADVEGADVGGVAVVARAAHEAGAEVTEEGAALAITVDGGPAEDAVATDVPLSKPVPALVEASKDADLLVVGHRGRGAVAGALLGSVAFAVAAHAACPVVVVRGNTERRLDADHPVVVGVDGSDGALASVDFAARAAARASAPLIVLAAWTPPDLVGPGAAYGSSYVADLAMRAQDAAQDRAEAALARVRAVEPHVTGEVRLVRDRPARALITASGGAGMVVVGARGRGSTSGSFLGSVSHATVHGAHCPVVVVRRPLPS